MSNINNLPKINQSKVVNIRGKDVATYEAALDYAHQCGMMSLAVDPIQLPNESNGNTAIFSAELKREDGAVFKDIGDANPNNVPRGCTDSFIRIAASRAKSRVISDAYNIRSMLDDNSRIIDVSRDGKVIDVDFEVMGQSQQPTQKQALNGGGSKPLSAKQEGLINSLAQRSGSDAQSLAMQMFGKSVQELQGSEANELIQSLK
jgi:hypothetical protein